jgi:uncharacterized protein (TIGR03086 family)
MTNHTTSDTRPLYAAAVETATSVVDGVRLDQMDLPTPCGEFSVRTLLGHIVMVLRRVTAVGHGLDPMSVNEDVATDVADTDWSAKWAEEAAQATAAWADGKQLSETIVFPWVSHSGAATLVMYAGELSTHTWDLATATGQSVEWNDDVLAASLASLKGVLPDPKRATAFEAARDNMPPEFRDFPAPFADAVEVPANAPLIDQLIAWSGRQP